jgi:hypothetical protein
VQVALPVGIGLVLEVLERAAGDEPSRSRYGAVEPVAGLAERQARCAERPSQPGGQIGALVVVAAGL